MSLVQFQIYEKSCFRPGTCILMAVMKLHTFSAQFSSLKSYSKGKKNGKEAKTCEAWFAGMYNVDLFLPNFVHWNSQLKGEKFMKTLLAVSASFHFSDGLIVRKSSTCSLKTPCPVWRLAILKFRSDRSLGTCNDTSQSMILLSKSRHTWWVRPMK